MKFKIQQLHWKQGEKIIKNKNCNYSEEDKPSASILQKYPELVVGIIRRTLLGRHMLCNILHTRQPTCIFTCELQQFRFVLLIILSNTMSTIISHQTLRSPLRCLVIQLQRFKKLRWISSHRVYTKMANLFVAPLQFEEYTDPAATRNFGKLGDDIFFISC